MGRFVLDLRKRSGRRRRNDDYGHSNPSLGGGTEINPHGKLGRRDLQDCDEKHSHPSIGRASEFELANFAIRSTILLLLRADRPFAKNSVSPAPSLGER